MLRIVGDHPITGGRPPATSRSYVRPWHHWHHLAHQGNERRRKHRSHPGGYESGGLITPNGQWA